MIMPPYVQTWKPCFGMLCPHMIRNTRCPVMTYFEMRRMYTDLAIVEPMGGSKAPFVSGCERKPLWGAPKRVKRGQKGVKFFPRCRTVFWVYGPFGAWGTLQGAHRERKNERNWGVPLSAHVRSFAHHYCEPSSRAST